MRLTTYSEKQKIDAVKLWLVTGNLSQTAEALDIPYDTMKGWRYSKWWQDTSAELKSENRLVLSAKLRKIAEKALDRTLESLEKGDETMSPTGEMVRKQVSAAVASKITVDLLERAEQLENIPEEGSLQSVNDRLKSLMDNFDKFSKKVRRIEVEDVPFVSTVPEQGLLEDSRGESSGDILDPV